MESAIKLSVELPVIVTTAPLANNCEGDTLVLKNGTLVLKNSCGDLPGYKTHSIDNWLSYCNGLSVISF